MQRAATFVLLVSAALAPFAAAPAYADPGSHRMIESSVETTGAAVRFPDQARGNIELVGCEGCTMRSLQLAPDARFTLNGASVTLSQLRSAANGRNAPLTIHFRLSDNLVTRVDLVVF